MKRILVIPDLQIPLHDEHVVRNVIKFAKSFKADQTVTLGDEMDMTELGRWSEGKAEWFAQTLDDNRNMTVEILWELGVTDVIRSNHTDRLYNQISSKIPALGSLPELRFEKFLKFDELGIKFHRDEMNIAPGWIAVHGDHTPIKPQGGLSALEGARRRGKNVISGHTHRAGRSSFTEASGGRIGRILHGVEAGHLMDFRQAGYVKGVANWQQAFAIMYVKGKNVQVDLIYIEKDGTFTVQGKVYGKPRNR
jgi:predicted phosphodiesterase